MLNPSIEPLHPHLGEPTWWNTVLFELKMRNHRVSEICLHPVSLGRDAATGNQTRSVGAGAHRKTDGRPFMVSNREGAVILDRMKALSVPLGTRIEVTKSERGLRGQWTDESGQIAAQ
jgi:hypothetical protein